VPFDRSKEIKLNATVKSDLDALMDETMAYLDKLHKSGHLIAFEYIEPAEMVTMVGNPKRRCVHHRRPLRRDEGQLDGFWLIDARDLTEAFQTASNFPSARTR
jgi:hypothetical protein